jgi:RNA polymerase sigma factor (sigma-70 family)
MAIKQEPSDQALLDRQIVQEVLDGDSNSFQKLMDRYYDIIYYTLLKMVYSKKTAAELTLEVFSKAFQSLPSYSSEYAFSTWLFKIATNSGIDAIRRKKPNTVVIEEENQGDYETVVLASDSQQQPDELLMRQQKAGELRSLVEKLKPFWKELIELRYYKELSYEEIAEQLDLPMGTVKSQLYRAKQKLSKIASKKEK